MTALEREGRQPSRSARRFAGWLVGALVAAFAAGWMYLGVLHPVVTVMTPSMVPTLHVGDVALMESLRGSRPKVGEIVLVPVPMSAQEKQGYPSTVTHRIVAIRNGIITTKGDGRPAPDPFSVPAASVHERMLTVVPGAGRVLQFAVSPFGLVWLAFGVII